MPSCTGTGGNGAGCEIAGGDYRVVSEIARLPGAVTVREDPVGMVAALADWILDIAAEATSAAGEFHIALTGGSTPRPLYQALAAMPWRERAEWGRWDIFFGDERACPPDDPRSNYRLARETLLDQVTVRPERVHRMRAELSDLDAAAAEYSTLLAATCPSSHSSPVPRLDCVLLGLGENGHTASLFPGTPALQVRDRWATRGLADYEPHDRITLTFPVLNAAAHVAFLVTGPTKGNALRGVLQGTAPAAGPQTASCAGFSTRRPPPASRSAGRAL